MALLIPLSSSCANIIPIVESDVEIYNIIGLFISRGKSIEGFHKYAFISSNAF